MTLGTAAIVVVALLSFWHWAPLTPPKATGYTRITSDGRLKGAVVTDGARLYFMEWKQFPAIVAL